MPKVIRAAVIGAGNMGRNHLRTYSALEGVELVALADINPEAAKLAQEYETLFYDDYQQMINQVKPDVVSIVVPTPLHHSIGMEVIKRGINCLIEKPIASTPEEADKLIQAAKKQKVIFTVGHVERYNPMILKLKKLIDDNEIGTITSVIAKRVGGFPEVEPKTDVIIDLAVHDIEIISYLLGKQPIKVYGHGSKTLHSSKVDSAEILMEYNGASGFIQANWITPVKIRNIAVTGSAGYIEGNYITQEITYYKHSMKPKREGFKNYVVSLGEPEKVYISETIQEPLKNELNTFIEAVFNNDDSKLVSPISAREALKIALNAIKGSENE